jgi:hypothetical protein
MFILQGNRLYLELEPLGPFFMFRSFTSRVAERSSCLVTIQNERENECLVDVIKNSDILHLFVAVNH